MELKAGGARATHGVARTRRTTRVVRTACTATNGLVLCVATAAAQGTIAARVAAAPDGEVRIAFAARPGICGEGDCISTHHGRMRFSTDVEWDVECDDGPVRVVLNVRDHVPLALHTYVGGHWRPPASGATVTDLGTVGASEAASFLLGLAHTAPSSVGSDAILPATLADSATIWPALAGLARDASRPQRTREQAVFWLGQAAGDVTASLDSLAVDDSVDRQVREQAVFALSQRPRDEGVPALIQIAKTNHDPEIRRKALFWLGQSGDPRAVDLFEQILTKE
jgi:HEAT repeats